MTILVLALFSWIEGRGGRAAGAYLVAFFEEDLIVFAEGNAEDYGGDVFEAVDPFLAFASLAADVEHAVRPALASGND